MMLKTKFNFLVDIKGMINLIQIKKDHYYDIFQTVPVWILVQRVLQEGALWGCFCGRNTNFGTNGLVERTGHGTYHRLRIPSFPSISVPSRTLPM